MVHLMDLSQMLQQGAGNVWLFVPTAILLGALHGLEPGHSKTMMAAFIIAIRGTITQAVLLGLSAAISHSLIIWLLAAAALRYGSQWSAESTEPYFQIASGVLIAALGAWMFWRTRRDLRAATAHTHDHDHGHAHSENFLLDTGHEKIELSVFEEGVPPVFRLRAAAGDRLPRADSVSIETVRPDGTRQTFVFASKGDFLESTTDIPEPHEFDATLTIQQPGHGHAHSCRVEFREDAHHHHHGDLSDLNAGEFADAHEQAHAEDIAKRFTNRTVTTPQIIWFGITGGLMPCPAAFSVLLVCLQLKRFTLGFALVGAFSLGLALTMIASGVVAAWGVRHAEKRLKNFGKFARRAPYVSAALLTCLAVFFIVQGWRHLP